MDGIRMQIIERKESGPSIISGHTESVDVLDRTSTFESQELGLNDVEMHPESRQLYIEADTLAMKTSLMCTKHQQIDFKEFHNEVRAVKDVEAFLERPVLLLDLHETSVQGIVDSMLNKMIASGAENFDFEEARAAFFTRDSVHCLAQTIQGTEISEGGGWEETQNWLVTMAELHTLQQGTVAIARLKHAVNLGRTLQETHFVVLVLAPRKTKRTKSSLETGRTFATLLSDIETRQCLLDADSEEQFKNILTLHKDAVASGSYYRDKKRGRSPLQSRSSFLSTETASQNTTSWRFGHGLIQDIRRRLPHYLSDFTDGITGHRTVYKLVSTVLFLYFACLLPSIAFGVLNSRNTGGQIDVQKVIISQTIGGVLFALLGGQPLVILLTTAPLALYIKVIYSISEDFQLDFLAMYSCIGLWNAFFLMLYSFFGLSQLMKWSTRSTEEIFALFISIAFTVDAIRAIYQEFSHVRCTGQCNFNNSSQQLFNQSRQPVNSNCSSCDGANAPCLCNRQGGMVYILLSLGTVWVGLTLYNFRKSPFLDVMKREAMADYALVVAVLFMSFIASFVLRDIPIHQFEYSSQTVLQIVPLHKLSWAAVFSAAALGFCLSLLFFMDQNISSALVNNPGNRLKKGPAYHLDLLVVALLNGFLSLFGLPWVHAAIPHSPLHVRALADVEERIDQGHIFEIIVRVRETRLSGLMSHILIGLSLLMLPTPLQYIPPAVLDGLFLFVAATSLSGNQMFERALLLITEQAAYPPNHYIRHVPQKKIHLYTGLQLLQLAVLCGFSFAPMPYLKMVFPVLLLLILPVRHILVPKLIPRKFLDALDTHL